MQALDSSLPQENTLATECQQRVHRLQARNDVRLQWVPGHCLVHGNERELRNSPKQATHNHSLVYQSATNRYAAKLNHPYKRTSTLPGRMHLLEKGKTPKICKRVLFSLPSINIVHYFIQSHLCRLGLADSSICLHCHNKDGTADHLT